MRLAISNIAWSPEEDDDIARLLRRYAIDAIDIAPGKYFPHPAQTTAAETQRVRDWWQQRGIEITGMQALLFGTKGLNIFGSQDVQKALLDHLAAVCRIGEGLGATRLVFGSPKNRDRTGLSDEQALDMAVSFLKRLGDIAGGCRVSICLEPVPGHYGGNFMTTSVETARVVEQTAHPAIRMQLDTGALTINGEDASVILENHAQLIGHVHASEPDLVPLGDGKADHAKIRAALAHRLPNHIVSIEMLETKDEPHPASIERALKAAIRYYR